MRLRSPILAAFVAVAMAPVALAAGPSGAPRLRHANAYEVGRVHHSTPVLADVDGDGRNEVVVGDLLGKVHVLKSDGTELRGWPASVTVDGSRPTAVESTPTVVDLDGDRKVEIVVGAGSTWVPKQQGGLVILSANGTVRCRYRTGDLYDVWNAAVGARPDGFTEGVMSTAAIGDIDGDRRNDVVFGGWDNHLHAVDARCRPLAGFPWHNDDSIWSSPALHDVDRDGRKEIFVGGASTPGGTEDWKGGVLRSLEVEAGRVRERWKKRVDEVVDSSPAIGDIDGDGRTEVVVGTGVFWNGKDARRLFAWHTDDGSAVRGWPVGTGAGEVWASPSLGDVDGDGRQDVVVGSRDGVVRAHRGDGSLIWRVRPNNAREGGGEIISSAVIGDLDGDGANDVGIGNGWGYFLLRGRDGARLYEPVGKGFAYQNGASLGRFGPGWALVTAGMDVRKRTGGIWIHPVPAPGTRPPWPTWRYDVPHTGSTRLLSERR